MIICLLLWDTVQFAPLALGSTQVMGKAEDSNQASVSATSHSGRESTGHLHLPQKVGIWTRPDSPQVVTAKTIFNYMDGAGELYLGYRFRQLEVFNYAAVDQDEILVELYWMESSDVAFGLLSQD